MNATNQAREAAEELVADIQSERERLRRLPLNPVATNRRRHLLGVLQGIGLSAIDSLERTVRRARDTRQMI